MGTRVLALITDAFGGHGGIALYNRDLLIAMCAHRDVEQVVALPRVISHDLEPMPDTLVYRTFSAKGTGAYFLSLLVNLPAIARANMIYCGHINLVPIAWLFGYIFRKPVVLAIYGIDAWQPTGRSLVDRLVKCIPDVISISGYTKARFIEWSKMGANRVHLLPNAIHLENYGMEGNVAAISEKYGLSGHTVLMTLGRIVSKERAKGFDEVLELLPELASEIPDLVYVIVGDGDYKPELEAKARQLGVADRVVFTGFVSEEEKPDLYRATDVYVMPSRGEGFGFVFLEAMACGVPVVASSVDGSSDAVLDGELGLMVDPDDRTALKAAILAALKMPKGIPPRLDYFSFAGFTARLHAIIDGIVGKA